MLIGQDGRGCRGEREVKEGKGQTSFASNAPPRKKTIDSKCISCPKRHAQVEDLEARLVLAGTETIQDRLRDCEAELTNLQEDLLNTRSDHAFGQYILLC
jgi:hypothetical protein